MTTKMTTEMCRVFLAAFFKATPTLVAGIYGDEEGTEPAADACVPSNWKRYSKCKPGSEASRLNNCTHYEVYEKGAVCPRGPHYHSGTSHLAPGDVAWERTFVLRQDKYDSGVMFLVLETVSGELHLGSYVGD